MKIMWRLALAICAPLTIVHPAFASCSSGAFSGAEDNVMRAYVAYYGRPADSSGLAYWANRMVLEGGSLDSIIADFGVSKEFTDRYGSLTRTDLVKGIYRQLFGRDPETAGLNYYVGELTAGRRTLQTIALDVLFGAQNEDATIVANRLAAAKNFTSGSVRPGINPGDFDGDAMAAVLASVSDGTLSRDTACGYFDAMLDALGGAFVQTYAVTKTADSGDGACNGDCSLREAVAAANAAGGRTRINLPAGIHALNLGQLFVTGDVHIHGVGAGASIIDGNLTSRLFGLESPTARLVLSRLTLRNGNGDFGGALLNKGTAILDRVTLTGNRARNGGGILNTGSLTGLSLTVSGNQAASLNASTGFGGGLNNESGSYGLFASDVSGNSAPYNGGGIYAAGSGTIVNTLFAGNQSGATGGAIDTIGPLRLVGSIFAGNTGNDGGGLANRTASAVVAVSTSTFEDNVASGQDLGGGGAAFNYHGTLSFTDTTFSRNTAFGEGGGAIETNGALGLTNTLFDGNKAVMHNGALPGNTAPGFGGALLIIAGSTVHVDNGQFRNNIAGNSGGAIYNDRDSQLVITSSQFAANQAQGLFAGGGGYGGAIASEGNVTLSNSTLASNASKEGGGALSTNVGNATISNSTLSNNSSKNGAGAVAYSGTLAVTDTVLGSNTATQWGGGLLNDTAQTTLTRVTLTGNHAFYGGAFSNNNVAGRVSLDGSTINGNTASDGSAFVNFGTVNLRNSTVSGTCNNHATVNNQGGNTIGCSL